MAPADMPDTVSADEQADNLPAPQPQVRSYLASLADTFGLPRELVHAVARTESGFDTAKVGVKTLRPSGDSARQFDPDNKAYGVMQVSDAQIGRTVAAPDGSPFQIGDDIKTDWKANARAGVALLAQQHQLAEIEQPNASPEEHAQQAYSGYSAGAAMRDRYLFTLFDDSPAHSDDRAFLQTLRNAAASSDDQTSSQQAPAKPPPQSQPARSADQSNAAPLPAPLQRLKEDPGDLFLQGPASSDEKNAASPKFGGIDLAPSLSNLPLRTRSLGDILAPLFSAPQASTQPTNTRPLPGPLEQLKENPGNLFLQAFAHGQHFSQVNLNVIVENEGGNQLTPYFPGNPQVHPRAGVTIGAGVDLGQHSEAELRSLGVPQNLIDTLRPFLGKQGPDAVRELVNAQAAARHSNRSLGITTEQANQLNRAIMTSNFEAVGQAYNNASPIGNFTDLPWEAQTVIADLWYNRGNLQQKSPVLWNQAVMGRWQDALHTLQNFQTGDAELDRRARKDAEYLKQAISSGALPRRQGPNK